MKKHLFLIIATFISICLIACNDSAKTGDQNQDNTRAAAATPPNPCEGIDEIDICRDAGGVANIVIEAAEAQKMMANFENVFKKEGGYDIRAFEAVYWLDKCEILGIEAFL